MKKTIIYLSMIGILLDQITKIIVTSFMDLYTSISIIPNVFYITYVTNKGAAWSILNGNRVFLILVAIIALIVLINCIRKEKNITTIDIITYTLLISGIIGNMIDRIIYGHVIDFISVYIFDYSFPIFNIADMFIVISVFLMIYKLIRGEINDINCK